MAYTCSRTKSIPNRAHIFKREAVFTKTIDSSLAISKTEERQVKVLKILPLPQKSNVGSPTFDNGALSTN